MSSHWGFALRRWAMAVDAQLGKSFKDFLVHDHHDLALLKGLGRQARMSWLAVQARRPPRNSSKEWTYLLKQPSIQSIDKDDLHILTV